VGHEHREGRRLCERRGVVPGYVQLRGPHRTLELNPWGNCAVQQSIADIVNGETGAGAAVEGKIAAALARPPKVAVPTTLIFDDASSDQCTLMEIVTQDRPGAVVWHWVGIVAAGPATLKWL